MATSLAKIRELLKAKDERAGNQPAFNRGQDVIYPFWNAPDNSTSLVRFLPDKNNDNTFFWAEKSSIRLTFQAPKEESGKKTVVLPSLATWGEKCSLKARASEEFQKRTSAQKKGGDYQIATGIWPKTTYILQGFVLDNAVQEVELPENPIRLFLLNSTLAKIVKDSLMDTDLENHPCDYKAGHNFRIKKSKKGDYADYALSSFSAKPTELAPSHLEAISQWGLFDLTERLGEKPNEETHQMHLAILNAYIDGQDWDDAWNEWVK